MLFDKLCGLAERHLKFMVPILKNARIFEFEKPPHLALPKEAEEEINYTFFLPFQVTAVEDPASCVIIFDKDNRVRGLRQKRWFIEIINPGVDESAFEDDVKPKNTEEEMLYRRYKLEAVQNKHYVVLSGHIDYLEYRQKTSPGISGFNATGELSMYVLIEKNDGILMDFLEEEKRKYMNGDKDSVETLTRGGLRNALSTIQEIAYLNNPDNFILEKSPVKSKVKKGRIPRSHQRPVYTILTPERCREQMGLNPVAESSGRKSPRPHDRRRHERFLSDDIYKKDAGGNLIEPRVIPYGKRKGELYYKRKDIPAIWVGPSENIVGNKRYKVRLDL